MPVRCVTVSYFASGYRYWQPAFYVVKTTKDGRRIWKYDGHAAPRPKRSLDLAILDAKALAREHDIPYLRYVRNNHCFDATLRDILE